MQQPPSFSVSFHFQKQVLLRRRKALKQFINECLLQRCDRKSGVLRIIFCSDEDLLRINRDFLEHDYFTDIITFDLGSAPKELEAEIYISVDRVRENAKIVGDAPQMELHRVIFHGVLHLCGFDDKRSRQKSRMKEMEDLLLRDYFNIQS